MVLLALLIFKPWVSLSEIAPSSVILETNLEQIVVAGPSPNWRHSDLEALAELRPVLRDGKRHFVRTQAARERLGDEDVKLTEQYADSWREALKVDPLIDVTADLIIRRFEQLHRELDEQRIAPGQIASAGLGDSVAALIVQNLESTALRLRDGEARLWSVDASKIPAIKDLQAVEEELKQRSVEVPKSNNGQAAYRATVADLKVWARCTKLTVFARRSGSFLHLATHGYNSEGTMLVFARRSVQASSKPDVHKWPILPAGALKITVAARQWLDFAIPRPALWFHEGISVPRSSLDQAFAELLLAHWAKGDVQTVAGWVPTSTLTTILKHRQGADSISANVWEDLKKTLVVIYDKERKLVLIRPRMLLAGERERMEPSVWLVFASGTFTFARWGAALAQSRVGVESNTSGQIVQRTLQAMEPRTPYWTALTFAAAKSESWLRVFAWTHPFPYDYRTPATRQSIWYIATGDVRTPLAYAGEMGKVEAFKDTKSPVRISSFWTARDWQQRAAREAIESDFEVGSIETHEARYRVQAIPNMVFGASVHDLGVGSGVIKRMRFEPN